MKLYEIDARINDLMAQLEPDSETGEITADVSHIISELDELDMDRQEKLRNICKIVLQERGEAAAIKAEEDRLKARRQRKENHIKSLMHLLELSTNGQTVDVGIATIRYSKCPPSLNVINSDMAIAWLERNGYPDMVKRNAPSVSANDVKKLIQSGVDVPGCEIVTNTSFSVK